MSRWTVAAGAALVLFAAACGGGGGTTYPATNTGNGNGNGNGTPQVPANTVIARAAIYFDPPSLTVAAGTSVDFVFESTAHNVTFNQTAGAPADIGGSNSNTTIARTFATPGTFAYHCTIHGTSMSGTVVVQ